MYTLRQITGVLRSADGLVRAGANVRIVRETATADGDAFPPSAVAFYTGNDGTVPEGTAVAVPASGSWPFALAIDNVAVCTFALGAGDPISVAEILALAGQQAGPDTAQAEFLNGLYALVNGAADGLMLETAGGDLALVESPAGTGGIEEPTSAGLWARLVDGVGSWLAATATGQALFTAVDEATARTILNAAIAAGAGVAGEVMVSDSAGNSVRSGHALNADGLVPDTVVLRGSDGGVTGFSENGTGITGSTYYGHGVQGNALGPAGIGGQFTGGSGGIYASGMYGAWIESYNLAAALRLTPTEPSDQEHFIALTLHPEGQTAVTLVLVGIDGVWRFVGPDAETNRAAQRSELNLGTAATSDANDFDAAGSAAAVASDLSNHEAATGVGVHGSTTVGRNLLTLPTWGLVRYLRINADGSITQLSAQDFALGIGVLQSANNLSDVLSQSAARDNIGAAGLGTNTFTGTQSHIAPITFTGAAAATNRTALRTEIGAEASGTAAIAVSAHETFYDHTKLLTPEQEALLVEILADLGYANAGEALTAVGDGSVAFTPAAGLGSNTFTGDQNLNGNELYGYRVREVAASVSGTYIINLLAGNLFVLTVTGNVTITFSNAPATGAAASATVILIQDTTGGHSVTFTGAKWDGGVAPDLALPAGQQADLSFIVRGSGADIRGYVAGLNMAVAA